MHAWPRAHGTLPAPHCYPASLGFRAGKSGPSSLKAAEAAAGVYLPVHVSRCECACAHVCVLLLVAASSALLPIRWESVPTGRRVGPFRVLKGTLPPAVLRTAERGSGSPAFLSGVERGRPPDDPNCSFHSPRSTPVSPWPQEAALVVTAQCQHAPWGKGQAFPYTPRGPGRWERGPCVDMRAPRLHNDIISDPVRSPPPKP